MVSVLGRGIPVYLSFCVYSHYSVYDVHARTVGYIHRAVSFIFEGRTFVLMVSVFDHGIHVYLSVIMALLSYQLLGSTTFTMFTRGRYIY